MATPAWPRVAWSSSRCTSPGDARCPLSDSGLPGACAILVGALRLPRTCCAHVRFPLLGSYFLGEHAQLPHVAVAGVVDGFCLGEHALLTPLPFAFAFSLAMVPLFQSLLVVVLFSPLLPDTFLYPTF